MKEGRLQWIQKNLDDTLLAAVLTAPPYVSGLTETEYAFVRQQFEKRAAPEIIEARDWVQEAGAEIERGWQTATARISTASNVQRSADGTWKAKQGAKAP